MSQGSAISRVNPPTTTLAEQQAFSNFAANWAALNRTQPHLSIDPLPTDLEWVFGKDRALTLRDSAGNWLTGCSLPRRAAAEMLKHLNVTGLVGCFLAPTHSAQLRVALDRLRPEQALIAIVPQSDWLPALLACDFFADDLDQHRLWFAVGTDWKENLKELFEARPGLCTPTQFVRLPILEEELVDSLIGPAQKIFGEAATQRTKSSHELRKSYSRGNKPPCVVTNSQFRLWDDAGHVLGNLFTNHQCQKLNADDPCCASPFALTRATADCGALVIANTGRSDLPGVLPDSIGWITWAAGDRIPSFNSAMPIDRIITASAPLATRAGWRSDQIIEASFPIGSPAAATSTRGNSLSLICNTTDLSQPKELAEYSSHGVLWEMIQSDLRADPFVLTDIDSFLDHRVRKLNIATETLDRAMIIRELILPAYQQSLARLLIRAKLSLQLFGAGWDRLPEFAPLAAGEVKSRDTFQQIVHQSAGLVHVWPTQHPHMIDTMGRPVLRRRGVNGSSFLSDASQILMGKAAAPSPLHPPLTAELILHIIGAL
jgi:hypothetical protein